MAEWAPHAPAFGALGFKLAAISVDSPERSERTRQLLVLPFPLLSDPDRSQVKAWGLLNARERGGIAVPATFVLDARGCIQWMAVEKLAERTSPASLLAYLRGARTAPASRRFFPRWRDWRRALGL